MTQLEEIKAAFDLVRREMVNACRQMACLTADLDHLANEYIEAGGTTEDLER